MALSPYKNVSKRVGVLLEVEKKLKETENKYESLEAAVADPLLVCDRWGRVLMVNSHFERVFGWTLEQIRGRKIPFVPQSEKSITQRFMKEARLGKASGLRTKRLRKDGSDVDVMLWTSPFHDASGGIAGLQIILREATPSAMPEPLPAGTYAERVGKTGPPTDKLRKELAKLRERMGDLKKSEEQFQRFLQNHSEGIAIVDRNGTYAEVNPAFARMLGYSPARRSSSEMWVKRVPPQLRFKDSELWEKALGPEGLLSRQIEFLRKDGVTVTFLVNASVLERRRDGNHVVAWSFSELPQGQQPGEVSPTAASTPDAASQRPKRGKGRRDAKAFEEESVPSSTGLEHEGDRLSLLLRQADEHKTELVERITHNYALTVEPIIEHLRSLNPPESQRILLETLDFNIRHITSLFGVNLAKQSRRLSRREIEICQMIRAGKDSREIAQALGLTYQTIMVHRKHIRQKLGLKKAKLHLGQYLQHHLDNALEA